MIKIQIEIEGETKTLTMAQARSIYNDLHTIFNDKTSVLPSIPFQPLQPPFPGLHPDPTVPRWNQPYYTGNIACTSVVASNNIN